jgi:hypothetical protein
MATSVTSLESVRPDVSHESLAATSLDRASECPSNEVPSAKEQRTVGTQEQDPARTLQKAHREGKRAGKERKARTKQAEKERKAFLKAALKRRAQEADQESPNNFIVLPKRGTDHQWIRVPVAGAQDEIAAHCGLFFRDENPGYQQLIEDVGNIVRGFWDGEGGLRHSRSNI